MKKIAIIGAGVSGLTAGIYAQKAGFETEIYEKHSIAGGECTGWSRDGYHIDGCIHWLTGTKKGSVLNGMWNDTGALSEDIEIIKLDNFGCFESNEKRITLSRDLNEFKCQLLTLSPEDSEEIEILCGYLKRFEQVDQSPCAIDLLEQKEKVAFLKEKGDFFRLLKTLSVSAKEYSERFKNPTIKSLLNNWFFYSDVVMSQFLMNYGVFIAGNADTPRGGSLKMAQRMKEKYLSLGGKIFLKTEVQSMDIVDGSNAQIVLTNGKKVKADYIISSCDAHLSLKLLGKNYADEEFDLRDENPQDYPLMSSVLHSFKVDGNMEGLPQMFTFEKDIELYGTLQRTLGYKCYNFEPSFAPHGKSIMQVTLFGGNYDFWKKLSKEEYEKAKEEGSKKIIQTLEEKFPSLKNKLEILDVATPLTSERYCGAYKGSWMAWGKTDKSKGLIHDGKIKGVDNLFLAGQWLMPPGGLPLAISGKWAVQRIAKKEGMDWRKI
ncbi:MAG: NAD(P)/FAD-dependent oxidoreductase [Firmicutes bacterium]|nr:NAD(P)/FAD-dependent oxidoreductase [Bacillota bacterium]